MQVGTSHFRSKRDARRYYRPYLELTPGWNGDEFKSFDAVAFELELWIDLKIKRGEIHIGRPTHLLKKGDSLAIDRDGRYHIKEEG
tara:strand:+ start:339 stop:596 length:258 start_codon:yes stop_codon:yes gene_type:complete